MNQKTNIYELHQLKMLRSVAWEVVIRGGGKSSLLLFVSIYSGIRRGAEKNNEQFIRLGGHSVIYVASSTAEFK